MIDKKTPTVKNIIKTQGIYRFDCNQTVSQILPKLTSSHDAGFVFDKEKFLGVVSPYYLFKNRSVNDRTKLKSAVVMPPKLKLDMNFSQVASLMIESHVYFLPVVNDIFEGIVTINRLLQYSSKNNLYQRIIVSNSSLITLNQNQNLSAAISLMSKNRVARLPIVDDNNRLVGMISQFDLKEILEDKSRDGDGKSNRKGEKKKEFDRPVKEFMNKYVFTVNSIPSFSQAVSLMSQNKVGSLVIVDKDNHPIGIITKRDLLNTITQSSHL